MKPLISARQEDGQLGATLGLKSTSRIIWGEGGLSVMSVKLCQSVACYLCFMSVLCFVIYCARYAAESKKNCPLGH